ncbi:MAG: hypothetical protein M3P34_06545, partial [Actinomycetota bacterium]|nr:hypothetical protein [Actinomycetota bacterium]
EPILPGVTVRDFWTWALGDLRLNTNWGMLAQFLDARAVGDDRPRDDRWGNFDVLTPEGVRVEVKSSGYLQSWGQPRPSRIAFSGLLGLSWSAETGYSAEPEVRADVFVYAVHTRQDPGVYDPLDLDAWAFYVLPGSTVRRLGQKFLRLSRVRALTPPPTPWAGLRSAVLLAAER